MPKKPAFNYTRHPISSYSRPNATTHTLFPLKPNQAQKYYISVIPPRPHTLFQQQPPTIFLHHNTQAKTIRPAILANSPISCQKSTIFPQPPITTPDSITMSRQVLYFLINTTLGYNPYFSQNHSTRRAYHSLNTTLKSDYFRTANSLLIEPSWPYILSIRHRTL